jgi:hypothetical protein
MGKNKMLKNSFHTDITVFSNKWLRENVLNTILKHVDQLPENNRAVINTEGPKTVIEYKDSTLIFDENIHFSGEDRHPFLTHIAGEIFAQADFKNKGLCFIRSTPFKKLNQSTDRLNLNSIYQWTAFGVKTMVFNSNFVNLNSDKDILIKFVNKKFRKIIRSCDDEETKQRFINMCEDAIDELIASKKMNDLYYA